jgi:hypothetical protein
MMHQLTPLLSACRLLWAAPCSALGLCLGAVVLLAGGRMRWVRGALECSLGQTSALVRWLSQQPFAAITLGHVIFAPNASDLRRWHAHERVHVRQFERWGALMLLVYPAASLWAWLQGEDAYLANCFEREAYRSEVNSETNLLFFQ